MVSVDTAVATVLANSVTLAAERLPLSAVLGRVLAEDVTAAEPHPPFPASIKDGFAVHCADGAGDFPVAAVARATASEAPAPRLEPGTVAYITTGAPLPDGADAVVQVENTEDCTPPGGARRVRIRIPARAPGEDVRQIGSDVSQGQARCGNRLVSHHFSQPPFLTTPHASSLLQVVLRAGDRLAAAEVGILASVGAVAVTVHAIPVAAVLSTGDELAAPDTPDGALSYGAVRDSNRPMLLAGALDEWDGC